MSKTVHVSREEAAAAMPEWIKNDIPALCELYHSDLAWRAEMFRAEGDKDAQDRIRHFVRQWDMARNTITLSEAERRWKKSNLRQNPIDFPFRWQSEDGRGTWLTTVQVMERCFGTEPVAEPGE